MDKIVWIERALWLFGLGALVGGVTSGAAAGIVLGLLLAGTAFGLGVWRGQNS